MSTQWPMYIQVTERFKTWDEAFEALSAQRMQEGYLGGRLLSPGIGWGIQAFFEPFLGSDQWLPDGMKLVMVPPRMVRLLTLADTREGMEE